MVIDLQTTSATRLNSLRNGFDGFHDFECEKTAEAWQVERERLQRMLAVERSKVELRRKAVEMGRRSMKNTAKKLTSARELAIEQLKLEHKRVQDFTREFSQEVSQSRCRESGDTMQNQAEGREVARIKDPMHPESPLVLTRGLARQLMSELEDAVNQHNPVKVLEDFGLGKGPEAWVQVEQAMRPHLDQDPQLRQQWIEVVWA
mmetsp:Transcript_88072/g.139136  ORF Transcript_88072/g.139136 Transcript_88072/m.139136 type:complete len:204 (-) Transcript_88072:88-699(-)